MTRSINITPKKSNPENVCISDLKFGIGLGTLSLPNQSICSLRGLGKQPDMEILFLQNNCLKSFSHFETQPNLRELHLEKNLIGSFFAMPAQPKLEILNMEENPIAKHPHFRLMALLAIGSQIKKINGEGKE